MCRLRGCEQREEGEVFLVRRESGIQSPEMQKSLETHHGPIGHSSLCLVAGFSPGWLTELAFWPDFLVVWTLTQSHLFDLISQPVLSDLVLQP
jgi:hypothetical protein